MAWLARVMSVAGAGSLIASDTPAFTYDLPPRLLRLAGFDCPKQDHLTAADHHGVDRMTISEKRELEIRGQRRVFLLVFAIGCAGLGLAAAFELFRRPFALFAFVVATLLGLAGVLDRRVKLYLSSAGIRYGRWGANIIPWAEFSGYRLVTWQRNPHLQLFPHRPPELRDRFTWIGRLNNRGARLIGAPEFSIAITPLDISVSDLVHHVARYLPERLES